MNDQPLPSTTSTSDYQLLSEPTSNVMSDKQLLSLHDPTYNTMSHTRTQSTDDGGYSCMSYCDIIHHQSATLYIVASLYVAST